MNWLEEIAKVKKKKKPNPVDPVTGRRADGSIPWNSKLSRELQDKLEKEKSFSGTIYEIDSWNAEKFFNKREDLVKKKEKEETEDEVDPGSVLNLPNEDGSLPAIPGTLIPGITPQNDDSGEQ